MTVIIGFHCLHTWPKIGGGNDIFYGSKCLHFSLGMRFELGLTAILKPDLSNSKTQKIPKNCPSSYFFYFCQLSRQQSFARKSQNTREKYNIKIVVNH